MGKRFIIKCDLGSKIKHDNSKRSVEEKSKLILHDDAGSVVQQETWKTFYQDAAR